MSSQQLSLRLQCVRCASMDTKFCYFNNHSRSQPRYFCKTCRRHWTHGGTTRNVPVGGGVRRPNRGGGSGTGRVLTAQGQANSVGVYSPYLASQGQGINPVGVNFWIQNLNYNGPGYAVLMDPNDTSSNVYWDPSVVSNNSYTREIWNANIFPENNYDIGSTSGRPSDHGPSSTSRAAN